MYLCTGVRLVFDFYPNDLLPHPWFWDSETGDGCARWPRIKDCLERERLVCFLNQLIQILYTKIFINIFNPIGIHFKLQTLTVLSSPSDHHQTGSKSTRIIYSTWIKKKHPALLKTSSSDMLDLELQNLGNISKICCWASIQFKQHDHQLWDSKYLIHNKIKIIKIKHTFFKIISMNTFLIWTIDDRFWFRIRYQSVPSMVLKTKVDWHSKSKCDAQEIES